MTFISSCPLAPWWLGLLCFCELSAWSAPIMGSLCGGGGGWVVGVDNNLFSWHSMKKEMSAFRLMKSLEMRGQVGRGSQIIQWGVLCYRGGWYCWCNPVLNPGHDMRGVYLWNLCINVADYQHKHLSNEVIPPNNYLSHVQQSIQLPNYNCGIVKMLM